MPSRSSLPLLAYLLYRLLPALKEAFPILEHIRWQWIVGAAALNVLSEFGYVQAWRGIVHPERLLDVHGRGARTATLAAWAELGGGTVLPGGFLTRIGGGAWILRRFGMPVKIIAERQFNVSSLNAWSAARTTSRRRRP